MAALCYRCGFCGREFPHANSALFLDHMRACANGGVSTSHQSRDSGSDHETTTNSFTVETTDTRSETSSQMPRKRGRKPNALKTQPRQPTVFLNRSSSKQKTEKVKPAVKTPSLVRTPLAVTSSARISKSPVLPDEIRQACIEEILHGNRESVVQLVRDAEIEQLAAECMASATMSARLPAKFLPQSSSSRPKLKTVKGFHGPPPSKPIPTGLMCKLCGEYGFQTQTELTIHVKYCMDGYDVGKFDLRGHDSDDEYRPNSRSQREGNQVPDIPSEMQFCNYCRKPFDFWSKLRRHLLQNCSERRRLANANLLPPDDQLIMVLAELEKKKHQNKAKPTPKAATNVDNTSQQQQQPAVPMVWQCEYCGLKCDDRVELLGHLRKKCKRRLALIADDELLAHEDQLNRVKKMPPERRQAKSMGVGTAAASPTPGRPGSSGPQMMASNGPGGSSRKRSKHRGNKIEEGETLCRGCQRNFASTKSLRSHLKYCKAFKGTEEEQTQVQDQLPQQQQEEQERVFSPQKEESQPQRMEEEATEQKVQSSPPRSKLTSPPPAVSAPQFSYQGEDNLYPDDGSEDPFGDRKKDPSVLLEELASISPLGEDLAKKALSGAPLELAPPPIVLPKGVQLVEVFDSNGYVFKVPFDTGVDAQTALIGVISAINKRPKIMSPVKTTASSAIKKQMEVDSQSPRSSSRRAVSISSSSTSSESEDDEEEEEVVKVKPPPKKIVHRSSSSLSHPKPKKVPPPPPRRQLPAEVVDAEEFVASADWIRRQNESRIASGARRVKASSRYIE